MDMHALILIALKASICLNVFAIGLEATPRDALSLLQRPSQLARSLLAMNVVMPIAVAAVIKALGLYQAVEVALVALSVSPAPPLLPKRQIMAKGDVDYAIGLLVVAAAVAIVFIPLAIDLLGVVFHDPVHMKPWPVARLALFTILIPLGLGIAARHFVPAIAIRISRPFALFAMLCLAVAVLPVLFATTSAMWALVGNGTLVAIAAFVVLGLAVGHWLGGPNPHDRSVLALATATRHPAIALTIAQTSFPDQQVVPAILIYLILATVIAIPYIKWRQRVDAPGPTAAA